MDTRATKARPTPAPPPAAAGSTLIAKTSLISTSRIARAPERAIPRSAPPRPKFGARAVGSYVPRVTKKSFEKFGFSTAALLTEWATIVGADLARMTAPDRVKWPRRDSAPDVDGDGVGSSREGATLVLRVDGPRALEIQYKTQQITARINAYFGYAAIGAIRILQAPLTDEAVAAALRRQRALTRAPGAATSSVPMPDLAHVPCGELRAALARLHVGIVTPRSSHT